MPFYEPTTKDLDFVLHDVLKVNDLDIPGFDEMDRDFTGAVLEEAGKIARDVLAPLNKVGDEEGCKLENGVVRVPTGFEDAVNVLRDGGWTGFDCDPEYGGQGMPYTLSIAVGEMHSSANMALMMYPGLTHGCYAAIHAHGSEEQKQKYLPNLVSFKWGGTMNLTEPQCGTDLGLIRTKAEPQDDGTYKISGQKIWISAGEHEMAENIIHLVLAKIPGGPEGVKGISLFIVPKFHVNDDGSLGERNQVSCGGLESKMGIHGNATCVMNYDGATGYLIGDMHKGLRAMFTMMNEARLGVGMQGLAQASVAYQNALAFAKDRIQGRAVTGPKEPEKAADSIIHFPDVRRQLMDQKSFVEAGRAFMLWAATMIDRSRRNDDADAEGLVSLLIPVVKGFLTDKGLEATISSQQVYGGSGFTTEWGAEQFVRDCRIALIYEGTNGIQALDLVGRKLASDNGKHVMAFFDLVKTFIKENSGDERMAEFLDPLKAASKDLQAAGMYFMQNAGKPDDALSGAHDFMHLFGHVCFGLMWAKMAKASYAALDAGTGDAEFYESKLVTGRYYVTRKLPETGLLLQRINAGGTNVMGLSVANF